MTTREGYHKRGQLRLTKREAQVALLVTREMTNREIAEVLGIGPETVKTYLSHIMGKLGVRSRVGVALRFRHGEMHEKSG